MVKVTRVVILIRLVTRSIEILLSNSFRMVNFYTNRQINRFIWSNRMVKSTQLVKSIRMIIESIQMFKSTLGRVPSCHVNTTGQIDPNGQNDSTGHIDSSGRMESAGRLDAIKSIKRYIARYNQFGWSKLFEWSS